MATCGRKPQVAGGISDLNNKSHQTTPPNTESHMGAETHISSSDYERCFRSRATVLSPESEKNS
jgi:hypothetical protein